MSQSSLSQIAKQERTRREILHKSDLIPPLPDLVARVLGVLNKRDTEPEDLEKLLQNDQVLVAKMLAMVNSPFYGMNRAIRTIKEAVMVLGFRGVRSLVLATSTAKILQRDFGWYGHEPKGLWLHAVCVAAGSRLLAKRTKLSADECEQLFVGGLLHDIGKLLLLPYVDETPKPKADECTVEVERSRIGIDHAEAGALVAAKWNLPEDLRDVIAGQHAAPDSESAQSTWLSVVRLSDSIATTLGVGYLPDRRRVVEAWPADRAQVGLLDDAAWSAIRDEMVVAMEDAVQALGDLGS
ncbi:MAG: HDOD domain-containing protein [Planctomycetota bacterium]